MYQVITFTDDFKVRVLSSHEDENTAELAAEFESSRRPHAYVDVIETET